MMIFKRHIRLIFSFSIISMMVGAGSPVFAEEVVRYQSPPISYTTQNINVNKKQETQALQETLIEPAAGTMSAREEILDEVSIEEAVMDLQKIPEPFESVSANSADSITEDILMADPVVDDVAVEAPVALDEVLAQDTHPRGVNVDDKIKLIVFGEDDLSGKYKVTDEGAISLPLIGSITVLGKSPREIEAIVTAELQDGYLKDPVVSIEVLERRPFYIMGEVRNPGSYDYVSDLNILQAVAIGGGYTYRANRKSIDVLRHVDVKANEGAKPVSMKPHSAIKPGDIIYVRERFF